MRKEMFRAQITGTTYVYYNDGTMWLCDSKDEPGFQEGPYYWQVKGGVIGIYDPMYRKWVPHVNEIVSAYGDYLGRVIVGEDVPKVTLMAKINIAALKLKWWIEWRRRQMSIKKLKRASDELSKDLEKMK